MEGQEEVDLLKATISIYYLPPTPINPIFVVDEVIGYL